MSNMIIDASPVEDIPLLPRKKGKCAAFGGANKPPLAKSISLKTYHFNPSPQIVELLTDFACVHKYDDRKTFKEAWEKTIADPDVSPIIQEETEKLKNEGYEGDALDKIFKSLKYYYVKKSKKGECDVAEKKSRKKYECLEGELLTQMDVHISSLIRTHITPNNNPNTNKDSMFVKICCLSPSAAFNHYCEINKEHIADLDVDKLTQIKKTYKNRFFRMKKMLSSSP